MKAINFSILLLLTIVLVSCKDKTETSKHTSIKTDEIAFTKDGELNFIDTTGHKIKQIDIEVAKTSYEQQTGLMYRKSMKADRGMLFVYDDERIRPNFYMKNTYIGLDLIYINAEHKIVDFNQNAKPLDESLLPSDQKSKYVLEVNAGMVNQWKLQKGDSVSFTYR